MSGFLLDTNCLSELLRVKPEPRVLGWMEAADERLLHLSVLTLGEIRKGLAGLAPGKRRTQIETWLEVELKARFSGRILPVDGLWQTAGAYLRREPGARVRLLPSSTDCWLRRRFITISRS